MDLCVDGVIDERAALVPPAIGADGADNDKEAGTAAVNSPAPVKLHTNGEGVAVHANVK